MDDKKYGIDRVLALLEVPGIDDLPVTAATLKRWRREDPATALARLVAKVGSQRQLGEILGVHQKTICVWARADLPADQLEPPAPRNEVERTVRAQGGQPKVAADLGVSQQSVSEWCDKGYVPVARAQEMEHLYGVPRTSLINPKLRNALGTGGEL